MTVDTTRIESGRIYLRRLDYDDCSPSYLGWLQDPEISDYLETRHSQQSLETIRRFVASVNANSAELLTGIFLREDDRHIGNIKVGPIRAHHPLADVSLLIGARDCWGKGYATEAISAISRHAFNAMPIQKLSASMYEPNIGSMKAFLAAGYRQEGRRRQHYLYKGRMVDLIELGALKEDLK